MPSRTSRVLLAFVLCAALVPVVATAAIGEPFTYRITVPAVDRIKIDGDLSDWPDDVAESALTHLEYGDPVDDADDHLQVAVTPLEETLAEGTEVEALSRSIKDRFKEYVRLNKRLPDEVLLSVLNLDEISRMADSISAYILGRVPIKQELLEEPNLARRLTRINEILANELDILEVEQRIDGEVQTQVQRNQREFYLNEQLRAIRKELGYTADEDSEIEEYAAKIEESDLTAEAVEIARREVGRLLRMDGPALRYLGSLILGTLPAVVVALRTTVALSMLLVALRYSGSRLPQPGRGWAAIGLVAALGTIIPFNLVAWAQRSAARRRRLEFGDQRTPGRTQRSEERARARPDLRLAWQSGRLARLQFGAGAIEDAVQYGHAATSAAASR